MSVIAKGALRDYWEINPDFEQQLVSWYHKASKADWKNPKYRTVQYASKSSLKNNRVVCHICGNKYRVIIELPFTIKKTHKLFFI